MTLEKLSSISSAAVHVQEASRLLNELSASRNDVQIERAEKERLSRELALRDAALDAGSSHFLIADLRSPQQLIVYINRACANAHGYEPVELLGKSVQTLAFREQMSAHDREQFQRVLARGESVRLEAEIIRRDGSAFWAGFVSSPVQDADGIVSHFVTVGADITARREADARRKELQELLVSEMREREQMAIELRLAQKLESVGRLAAGLAHEINTPIQYVGDSSAFLRSAYDDLLRLSDASRTALSDCAERFEARCLAEVETIEKEIDIDFLRAEVPRAFERTREGIDRVAGIVRAMKEFAYPDAIEQAQADLNHGLSTTLLIAGNEYKYFAAVITDFSELPPVTCNIGELNQVFLNIVVNAAHAIHDSGKDATSGRINIETRVVENSVEIVIRDNGCGIATDNVEKIFDPFFTTKEVGRGTGQGLAIARAIVVEKHGGSIEVASTVGVGTRFTLRLPIDGKPVAPPVAQQSPAGV